jgi:hypothetical protein
MTGLSGVPVRTIAFLGWRESKGGSGSIATRPQGWQGSPAQVLATIAFIFSEKIPIYQF